jgi:hypothetical protein
MYVYGHLKILKCLLYMSIFCCLDGVMQNIPSQAWTKKGRFMFMCAVLSNHGCAFFAYLVAHRMVGKAVIQPIVWLIPQPMWCELLQGPFYVADNIILIL